MNEELSTALVLLGVGMITVFIVLSFVVLVGNLLIYLVNRMTPNMMTSDTDAVSRDPHQNSKIAAITGAVEAFTKGKGKITSIKKI